MPPIADASRFFSSARPSRAFQYSASEIVGYWPALIDKKKIATTVTVEEL